MFPAPRAKHWLTGLCLDQLLAGLSSILTHVPVVLAHQSFLLTFGGCFACVRNAANDSLQSPRFSPSSPAFSPSSPSFSPTSPRYSPTVSFISARLGRETDPHSTSRRNSPLRRLLSVLLPPNTLPPVQLIRPRVPECHQGAWPPVPLTVCPDPPSPHHEN